MIFTNLQADAWKKVGETKHGLENVRFWRCFFFAAAERFFNRVLVSNTVGQDGYIIRVYPKTETTNLLPLLLLNSNATFRREVEKILNYAITSSAVGAPTPIAADFGTTSSAP